MPTFVTGKFPKLRSEDEFEDLVVDLLSAEWRTAVTRHGRRGQVQLGVDAFAQPADRQGVVRGVQCKNVDTLTLAQIEAEVREAETFTPTLSDYLIVTALERDGKLQREVAALTASRGQRGLFPVAIWFWQDVERVLGGHGDVIAKYFPQWGGTKPPADGVGETSVDVVDTLPTWLIGIGPEVVARGRTLVTAGDSVTVAIDGYVAGDEPTLQRLIAAYPTGVATDYVLLEELGEGRQIRAAPLWRRTTGSTELTFPISPVATRRSGRRLGQDMKLGPDGDLAIENGSIAWIGGVAAIGQKISVVLGTQQGEWFLDRTLGSRLTEIRDGYAPRLVERLWKLELIRCACIPTRSGRLQLPFVRYVHDLRVLGYDEVAQRAETELDLTIDDVGRWRERVQIFVPRPSGGRPAP